MSGYYPPGESGRATATEFTFRCDNRDCPCYCETWTAPGYNELGGGFLNNDDDAYCKACGNEAIRIDWADPAVPGTGGTKDGQGIAQEFFRNRSQIGMSVGGEH